MNKLWKTVFFVILGLYAFLLGLQVYDFVLDATVKIISLDATWSEAKQTLGWYTLGLLILNAFVYKFPFYGSARNQIETGFLACSVLALLYFSLSRMLLPYIFFVQVGRLDLFLK